MARKFLTSIDLSKNELQNGVIQNLGSAPSSPVKGQLYFNSTDNTLYWWNGTAWVAASPGTGFPGFGTITQETTFGTSKSDGVATTTARADHAHGNPTHVNADHASINISALAAPTADVSWANFKIINLAAPASGGDATNKTYVDNAIAGLSWKDAVRAGTTANITLSGGQTIDGILVTTGDRVLVKNQTTVPDNGIYIVAAGAWTRATDADSDADLAGMAVLIQEGTTLADTGWVCTANSPITVGTTNLPFVQFSGAGVVTAGAGLTQSGNTINFVAADGSLSVNADDVRVIYGSNGSSVTAARSDHDHDSRYVNVTGDAMSGHLTLPTGPAADQAVRKDYVDTAVAGASKRFAAAVGGSTAQTITHNLATRDVDVQVYRNATPWDTVDCDVERTDTNNVTLRFAVAPAASEYRVVVLG